jgi:hypothetical protein
MMPSFIKRLSPDLKLPRHWSNSAALNWSTAMRTTRSGFDWVYAGCVDAA